MGGQGQLMCNTEERKINVCACAQMNSVYARTCALACTHPSQSIPPTHLHGLLKVLGGCTEAVDGEVLHNRVDPLTSRGHHTKSPPLHLADVNVHTVQAIKI